ncbi:MAG: DNA polymerase III subunit delta [Pirellulales bacterium]|nr:DNA polymerase III subunit delta [Pirellulales bacterium]
MPAALNALDYLAAQAKHPAPAVCVAFGDEPFLKREVLLALRREVLGGGDGDFSLTRLEGRAAALRDVLDELATLSLFGSSGRRLVVVEGADEFVSAHRAALEDYVAKPRGASVLLLDVKTFPSTTRLYKAVASSGLLIDCAPPTDAKIQKWLVGWARERHEIKLEAAAAELMVEIVGRSLGVLDQELAKLAAFAGPGETVKRDTVADLVGGWRAKTIWVLLDAALEGDAKTALEQLDLLLGGGENPVGLMAQMGSSLRRFAAAARLIAASRSGRGAISLRDALVEAGMKPFVLAKAEAQLRQLGRARAEQLYTWLLETDLALKGASSLPPRTLLEQLIVRLSKGAAPPAPAPEPRRGAASAR